MELVLDYEVGWPQGLDVDCRRRRQLGGAPVGVCFGALVYGVEVSRAVAVAATTPGDAPEEQVQRAFEGELRPLVGGRDDEGRQ